MKLDTWIEKTGPKVIAKKFRVDPSTVSYWRSGTRCPNPRRLYKIHQMSGGKVSYKEMIEHFVPAASRK